jgi:ribosomal protein S12 methylthiotransferase
VVAEPEDADVVIVNTCGFIETAKQESIDTLLSVARLKQEGNLKAVIAVGCLAQRHGTELKSQMPEVDAVLGISDYSAVPGVVRRLVNGSDRRWVATVHGGKPKGPRSDTQRMLLTPKSYAYLRISEGCDHKCTFCAIPSMRGRNRSKPLEVLVEEARNLAAAGIQELVVVAEDSTAYGLDLYLLQQIAAVDGIRWVRLMYAYPHTVGPELTTVLRENPKLVKYLDIPIQHVSSPMLRAMKRGVAREQVTGILHRLREEVPGIAVRSTFITGFPGETAQDFAELLEFTRAFRFERLGVFPYSLEEGTPSYDLPDRVPAEVAQARAAELMAVQKGILDEYQRSFVGRTVEVLVDGWNEGGTAMVGRTQADAPEVDCTVVLPKALGLRPGDLVEARITAARDYELQAETAAQPQGSRP